MHELPIIKSIYQAVIEAAKQNGGTKVSKVYLEVGVLRDFIPSFMKKYWAYVTKGDIAEGSELLIRELPAKARCGKCGTEYEIDMQDLSASRCPACGYEKGEIVSGRELRIFGIEIT